MLKSLVHIVFHITFLLMIAFTLSCNAHAKGDVKLINVKILSIKGCEATPPTIERVKSVAKELNIKIQLTPLVVESPEQAIKERFIGSPTVQINNLDIEPESRKIQNFGVT